MCGGIIDHLAAAVTDYPVTGFVYALDANMTIMGTRDLLRRYQGDFAGSGRVRIAPPGVGF